jgi:NADPH:quinone reductase-like Zn-dependent oxidoreductase
MKMKSWQFDEFGSIENLKLTEVDRPQPAAEEALIKLHYAGLNPADKFLVMGRYPGAGTPPQSVGRDGCGEVVIPGNSGRFEAGQMVVLLRSEVGISRNGTLAEFVTVPESSLAPLPEFWTPAEGAANPLVLLTNWQALILAAQTKANETVVITGASGGIGTSCLILSKAIGARTIALSRSEEKRTKLLEMGADHVLDVNDEKLVEKVQDLGGADVVIENICGSFFNTSLKMANHKGRICIIGALGGIKAEMNPLLILFKRLQVHGIQVGDYTDVEVQHAWKGIVTALSSTGTSVPIDKEFTFEEVQEAFAYMRLGPMGKIIIGPIAS